MNICTQTKRFEYLPHRPFPLLTVFLVGCNSVSLYLSISCVPLPSSALAVSLSVCVIGVLSLSAFTICIAAAHSLCHLFNLQLCVDCLLTVVLSPFSPSLFCLYGLPCGLAVFLFVLSVSFCHLYHFHFTWLSAYLFLSVSLCHLFPITTLALW